MRRILVVGEDLLCTALGESLVSSQLPEWQLARPSIGTYGRTQLVKRLGAFANQARHHQPVLCIADSDGDCVRDLLLAWRKQHWPANLLLRLAVTEAECWLLADRQGCAAGLRVASKHLPKWPEQSPDPKRALLKAAAQSKSRLIRAELVAPSDPSTPGSGYNLHLAAIVHGHWQPERAAAASPSLARAMTGLQAFRKRSR